MARASRIKEVDNGQSVSLERHFERILEALEDKMCLRVEALENKLEVIQQMSQIAIDKAEVSINERLTIMNEFREAMKDQQATYITKETFEASRTFSEGSLRKLELSKATLDGKADQKTVNSTRTFSIISALFGLAGFIFGIVNLLAH